MFNFTPTMWLTTSCHMTECQHRRILGVCVLPNISVACYYFSVGSRYRIFMLVGLCSIICEGDFFEETHLCPISCCPVGSRHPRRNTRSFCPKLHSSSNYHGSCMCNRSGRLCQLHGYPGRELAVPPEFRGTSRLPSRRSAIRTSKPNKRARRLTPRSVSCCSRCS